MMDEISIKLEKIIGEIKAGGINKIGHYDEANTKSKIIEKILRVLDWDGKFDLEYNVNGQGKVDYCLTIKQKSEIFIEAFRS